MYKRDVTPGAGHAYDTVRMLAAAFQKGGAGEGAAKEFRGLRSFEGVIGDLTVRDDGVIWSDASIKQIRNGQPELISP